jgi:hypothetical protein
MRKYSAYPSLSLLLLLQVKFQVQFPTVECYCTGNLRDRDIAGIWRFRSKKSFLPTFKKIIYPMKEFTVFPISEQSDTGANPTDRKGKDILLLLREDGNFVQYDSPASSKDDTHDDDSAAVIDGTMKGQWALVDGELILAADRPEDTTDLRADGKRHDTVLTGRVIATSGEELVDNPALVKNQEQEPTTTKAQPQNQKLIQEQGDAVSPPQSVNTGKEDVHLSVNGNISIGKFCYPQKHPSFFDTPMMGATETGSFELHQILGTLNTNLDRDDQLVEKFKKQDLMGKKYFLTSFPLPTTKRKKRQRWSIKYNKFVDDKIKSHAEMEREELEKNAPMNIKSFEVELFQNNTFATIKGLGDHTILRGKWSIMGEERDQLWMSVWRFGFGRSVSGSTYSEGSHLTHQDDVSYWGQIYEVDVAEQLDSIDDDPKDWKGTKLEVNGAVMLGVGLEPTSISRFTMIEKTEDDDEEDEEEEDDDYMDNLPILGDDVGSFE